MDFTNIIIQIFDGLGTVVVTVMFGYAVYKGILVTQGHNQQTEKRVESAEVRAERAEARAEKLLMQVEEFNKLFKEQQAINDRTTRILETVLVQGGRSVQRSD